MSNPRHSIQVDHSERESLLLELLRQSEDFDVRLARLRVGDYLINDQVLIERKTIADFAASLVDGRLFPQAARLARDGRRSLVLTEGPPATSMPDIHPNAVQGALAPYLQTCAEGQQQVVLDLTGLEYISSAGLRVLMLAAKQSKGQKGTLLLTGLQPLVKEILEISKFTTVLAILPSLRDALAKASPAALAAFEKAA